LGKAVVVWIFGFLTFLAILNTLEAFFALTQSTPITLLRLYPFSNWFGTVDVSMYFLGSLSATFVLWGVTCFIALRNPLDIWLGKILKEAQAENEEEVSIVSTKGNILEMMNDSLLNNSIELNNVKDLLSNVRAEMLGMRPVKDVVEHLKSDMTHLKTTLKKLETNLTRNRICPACAKDVQPDFRICPYCGENLLTEIVLKEPSIIKIQK